MMTKNLMMKMSMMEKMEKMVNKIKTSDFVYCYLHIFNLYGELYKIFRKRQSSSKSSLGIKKEYVFLINTISEKE